MSQSAIALEMPQYCGIGVVLASKIQTPEISPLVPCEIRVEQITIVGISHTPQLIYTTKKGRCSTLISKAQLIQCCRDLLALQGMYFDTVEQMKIDAMGITFNTNRGQFSITANVAQQFLSRYNRVALEPLAVKLTATEALVWNPQHHSISVVDEEGCSCPDWQYRSTLCKHQIAVQLCRR
ncbi:MAG: SWIM zinc finger family protein [Microcoleaceae cyanobacterium]